MQWIKVYLGELPDTSRRYLEYYVFYLYLLTHERKFTGYKEIQNWGFKDVPDYLKVYSSGGCVVKQTNAVYIGQSKGQKLYYFSPMSFYDANPYEVLINKNSEFLKSYDDWVKYDEAVYAQLPDALQVWFIRQINQNKLKKPADETLRNLLTKYRSGKLTINNDPCVYDEEMFKKLPKELQRWFIKKVEERSFSWTAQSLLESTYQKYVVRGEPVLYATTSKKEDVTNSLSTTSTEGSSTNTTN